MNKFDIKKIIERWQLDTLALAKALYPKAQYPKQAFYRVLQGKSNLDVPQLQTLAQFIGVSITDLFDLDSWHGTYEGDYIILTNGNYKVKFDRVLFTIYVDDKPIFTCVGNFNVMTFDEFIDYINNQIKLYENGSNQN